VIEQRKYIKLAAAAVGGLTLFFVVRNAAKNKKRDNTENDQSAVAQIAKQFDIAMHPINWGHWFPDGTDEKSIFEAAYRIINEKINLPEISKAYQAITKGRNLMSDLRSELDSSEYQKLQQILSDTYSPANDTENPGNPGYFMTIADGEFYKKPKDNFGIKFKGGYAVGNALLTGNKTPYYRYALTPIKIGDLLELKTFDNSTLWVKEDRVKKLSPVEFSQQFAKAKFNISKTA